MIQYLAQASTGRTMYEVRRAKSEELRAKPQPAAKKQLNEKNQWHLIKLGFKAHLPNKLR
jgi:hypothetical protein